VDRPSHSPVSVLLGATVALVGSALLLLLALVVHVQSGQRGTAAQVEPLVITGKRLQVAFGTGQFAGQSLEITGYQANNGEQIAIAVRRGQFAARDFPLLRYGVDFHSPATRVDLFWRLASDPANIKTMPLTDTDGGSAWRELARNPDWHGPVLEIGVYVTASDTRDHPSIAHLTLEPRSWWGDLCAYWSDWTAFRGWKAYSINYLYGTEDRAGPSPVIAVAAWSALAVALVLIAGLVFSRVNRGTLVAVVLVPWISLDLLWQHELDSQLARTRDQFAGKTEEEKHLADIDSDIYRYVQRLKQAVLPHEVSRIVILNDSSGHNFERLKTQFYLWPHNSYNFGRVPPDEGMEQVDYVLVLGEIPKLEYQPDEHALVWKSGKRTLPVELVDSDPLGRLYRVTPLSGGQEGNR